MPRTVSSKVRVKLSAQQTWQLSNHFELEKHIAALGNRTLSIVEEDVLDEGTENEQRNRVVRCELVGDHVGRNMMGVKSSDLSSDIVTKFFVHRFDEEHGTEFYVDLAMKRLNISITGRQWCLPESNTSCFVCTRVELEAKLPGVGSLIEMQLYRRMRTGHEDFAQHAVDFLKSTEMSPVPLPPSVTVPGAPEVVHTAVPTATSFVVEHPPPVSVYGSSGRPAINWPRLAWAFVTTGGIGRRFRARRHVVLESKQANVPNVTTVRLSRRHAGLLLSCGCADTLSDSEDVLE